MNHKNNMIKISIGTKFRDGYLNITATIDEIQMTHFYGEKDFCIIESSVQELQRSITEYKVDCNSNTNTLIKEDPLKGE